MHLEPHWRACFCSSNPEFPSESESLQVSLQTCSPEPPASLHPPWPHPLGKSYRSALGSWDDKHEHHPVDHRGLAKGRERGYGSKAKAKGKKTKKEKLRKTKIKEGRQETNLEARVNRCREEKRDRMGNFLFPKPMKSNKEM